jgi:Flp pilus assembly protein TadG
VTTRTGRAAPRTGGGADSGQATVELALLLPVVMVLVLLVLQAALVARDAVLVTHAAREAARAVAVDDDPTAARSAATGSTGLAAERLAVSVDGRDGAGSRARVEVRYLAPTDVPLVGRLLPEPTMVSRVTVRVE